MNGHSILLVKDPYFTTFKPTANLYTDSNCKDKLKFKAGIWKNEEKSCTDSPGINYLYYDCNS